MRIIHILDIDTTIADNTHRADLLNPVCTICLSPKKTEHRAPCLTCGTETSSHIEQSQWDLFFDPELVYKDSVVPTALKYVNLLRKANAEIHYLTGRNEDLREITQHWLNTKFNKQPNEQLIMRPFDEIGIHAPEFKERAINRFRMDNSCQNDVLFYFYEDDIHVMPMYTKYGIVIRCPEAWDHFLIKND